jgi:hypothetical protein
LNPRVAGALSWLADRIPLVSNYFLPSKDVAVLVDVGVHCAGDPLPIRAIETTQETPRSTEATE